MQDPAVERLRIVERALFAAQERIADLEEALTPSQETKFSYIGEAKFHHLFGTDDDGNDLVREVTVPWTTVKDIMKMIRARATAKPLIPNAETIEALEDGRAGRMETVGDGSIDALMAELNEDAANE